MIRVSATTLSDFNRCRYTAVCRKMRLPRITTASLILGSAVHDLIEEYENTGEVVTLLAKYKQRLASKLVAPDVSFYRGQSYQKLSEILETCFENYLEITEHFPRVLRPEEKFEFKYNDKAIIVGRFDQVRESDVIFELKSSARDPEPVFLAANVQALFYSWAYKTIYSKPAMFYYVSLRSGHVYHVPANDIDYIEENIRRFIAASHSNDLPKEYNAYRCKSCQFRDVCFPNPTVDLVFSATKKQKKRSANATTFAKF